MTLRPWHFVALGILLTAFGVGFWRSRRITLLTTAAVLLCLSGWLLHTLVLDECCLARDLNDQVQTGALIGVPVVAGGLLAAVAAKRPRKG